MVQVDSDRLSRLDVDSLKVKQRLQRNTAGAGAWWFQEPEHYIIRVHLPGVGHVDGVCNGDASRVSDTRVQVADGGNEISHTARAR